MLTLLPAIDVRGGLSVRPRAGQLDLSSEGIDPWEVGQQFADEGARWIHLVDLDAAFGTGSNAGQLHDLTAAMQERGLGVERAGGIVNAEELELALVSGAERIVLGSAAIADPGLVREALAEAGERLLVGVDVRGDAIAPRGTVLQLGSVWEALDWLIEAGAQQFVFTEASSDGMLSGPPLAALHRFLARAGRPVTASGGVASLEDLAALRTLEAEGLDGVIVGKALYAGRMTVSQVLALLEDEAPAT